METIWIETYSRQINKINRALEQASMMSTAPVGDLDLKETAEMFRGAITELKRVYEVNKKLQAELDKANKGIVNLEDKMKEPIEGV